MKIVDLISSFFQQKQQIRSTIIPIEGDTGFEYNADISKPYSFEIVNTGMKDMLINGTVAVKGGNINSMATSLNFPAIGIFKRNDVIIITSEGIGDIEGFIREDLELTG